MSWTKFGAYGVELFFALSGFLIGGLFFREAKAFGDVQVPRFMARRLLRTVPPYFVALALSYFAVRATRGQAFDLTYLVFLQNFRDPMPFFLVSWSLCIEEHFYLVFPMLGAVLLRLRGAGLLLCVGLVLLPMLFRAASNPTGIAETGYLVTATHLRFDGILLGVLAAWVRSRMEARQIKKILPAIPSLLFAGVCLVAFPRVLSPLRYSIGLFVLSFALAIAVLAADVAAPLLRGRAIKAFLSWVALRSYSIYLTHALAIHVARKVLDEKVLGGWGNFLVMSLVAAAAGEVLFRAVERPSILLRDRWVRRSRTSSRSEHVAPLDVTSSPGVAP